MNRLIVVEGEQVGQIISLDREFTNIGSSANDEIRLSKKDACRHHATLLQQKDDIYLYDNKSTTGIKVNGCAVDRWTKLRDGDRISIGGNSMSLAVAGMECREKGLHRKAFRNPLRSNPKLAGLVAFLMMFVLTVYFFQGDPASINAEEFNCVSDIMSANVTGESYFTRIDEKNGAVRNRYPIHDRERLLVGDIVETKENGVLYLVFSDLTKVRIGENSKVEILKNSVRPLKQKKQRETELHVLDGNVRARVTPLEGQSSFQINTPVSVAGVRGTDFFVVYDPVTERAEVGVFEGLVAVKSKGSDTTMEVSKAEAARLDKQKAETHKMEQEEKAKAEQNTIFSSDVNKQDEEIKKDLQASEDKAVRDNIREKTGSDHKANEIFGAYTNGIYENDQRKSGVIGSFTLAYVAMMFILFGVIAYSFARLVRK